MGPDNTLRDLHELKKKSGFSGIPITGRDEEGKREGGKVGGRWGRDGRRWGEAGKEVGRRVVVGGREVGEGGREGRGRGGEGGRGREDGWLAGWSGGLVVQLGGHTCLQAMEIHFLDFSNLVGPWIVSMVGLQYRSLGLIVMPTEKPCLKT